MNKIKERKNIRLTSGYVDVPNAVCRTYKLLFFFLLVFSFRFFICLEVDLKLKTLYRIRKSCAHSVITPQTRGARRPQQNELKNLENEIYFFQIQCKWKY